MINTYRTIIYLIAFTFFIVTTVSAEEQNYALIAKKLNHSASREQSIGSYPMAELLHRQALQALLKAEKRPNYLVARYKSNLGSVLSMQGKYSESLVILKEAASIIDKSPSPNKMDRV